MSFSNALAQGSGYTLLQPLPGLGNQVPVGGDALSGYLQYVFNLGVGIAIALAVVMIVIGGIQYLSTDAIFGKEEGKKKLTNALWGLLLALGAYLILNTINPDILKLNLAIKELNPAPKFTKISTSPILTPISTLDVADEETQRKVWFRDFGITVNNTWCKGVGDTKCTNVANLSPAAKTGIENIAKRSNCGPGMIITGGTEYWLHGNRSTDIAKNNTLHKPGGRAVDFSKTGCLDGFIKTNSSNPEGDVTKDSSGKIIGRVYYTNSLGTFLDEIIDGNAPHWHVTF